MNNIIETLERVEKSKLSFMCFFSLGLLYENECKSSAVMRPAYVAKFTENVYSMGNKLISLGLAGKHKIKNSRRVDTVFYLNEKGIQMYEYLTTGKKGDLF